MIPKGKYTAGADAVEPYPYDPDKAKALIAEVAPDGIEATILIPAGAGLPTGARHRRPVAVG